MEKIDDTSSVISKVSKVSKISKASKASKSSNNTFTINAKPPLPPHSSHPPSIRTDKEEVQLPEEINMTTIYKMLYNIQRELTSVKKDVKFLKDKHAEEIKEKSSKCIEMREQELQVPSNIALICLEYKSLKGEMELFKYCYINEDDKVKVPITCPNLHIFKYWCNNKWHIDVEGEHIKDTLFKNFSKVYFKVNRIQNYKKFDTARFTENQKHITSRLRDPSYQKKFMTALKALLKEI